MGSGAIYLKTLLPTGHVGDTMPAEDVYVTVCGKWFHGKKYGLKLAILLKCLDCSAGSPSEVAKCPVKDCPLWPFRKSNGVDHGYIKSPPDGEDVYTSRRALTKALNQM